MRTAALLSIIVLTCAGVSGMALAVSAAHDAQVFAAAPPAAAAPAGKLARANDTLVKG